MPLSTVTPGILVNVAAGFSRVPCASCLLDLGDASGMVGGEPCPLKAALLRRIAVGQGPAACAGFAAGYAEAGDDRESDFAGVVTRRLS